MASSINIHVGLRSIPRCFHSAYIKQRIGQTGLLSSLCTDLLLLPDPVDRSRYGRWEKLLLLLLLRDASPPIDSLDGMLDGMLFHRDRCSDTLLTVAALLSFKN